MRQGTANMTRIDGRQDNQIRETRFIKEFVKNSTGSVLAESGNTTVLCTVNCVPGIPGWMKNKPNPGGWLTCEYQMLPGSAQGRKKRENSKGPGGRSHEIQRLIGRSLRSVVDLKKLGPNTFYIDCDVINADGGTRCLAINGAMAAMQLAVNRLLSCGELSETPLINRLGAISVGIVEGRPMLDLSYSEDSRAEVDMNIVMTGSGEFVEVQGTAEGKPFNSQQLQDMLSLAEIGIQEILLLQS